MFSAHDSLDSRFAETDGSSNSSDGGGLVEGRKIASELECAVGFVTLRWTPAPGADGPADKHFRCPISLFGKKGQGWAPEWGPEERNGKVPTVPMTVAPPGLALGPRPIT